MYCIDLLQQIGSYQLWSYGRVEEAATYAICIKRLTYLLWFCDLTYKVVNLIMVVEEAGKIIVIIIFRLKYKPMLQFQTK